MSRFLILTVAAEEGMIVQFQMSKEILQPEIENLRIFFQTLKSTYHTFSNISQLTKTWQIQLEFIKCLKEPSNAPRIPKEESRHEFMAGMKHIIAFLHDENIAESEWDSINWRLLSNIVDETHKSVTDDFFCSEVLNHFTQSLMFEKFGMDDVTASLLNLRKQDHLMALLDPATKQHAQRLTAKLPKDEKDSFEAQLQVFKDGLPKTPEPVVWVPYHQSAALAITGVPSLAFISYEFSLLNVLLIVVVQIITKYIYDQTHSSISSQAQQDYEQQLSNLLKQLQDEFRKTTGPQLVRVITVQDEHGDNQSSVKLELWPGNKIAQIRDNHDSESKITERNAAAQISTPAATISTEAIATPATAIPTATSDTAGKQSDAATMTAETKKNEGSDNLNPTTNTKNDDKVDDSDITAKKKKDEGSDDKNDGSYNTNPTTSTKNDEKSDDSDITVKKKKDEGNDNSALVVKKQNDKNRKSIDLPNSTQKEEKSWQLPTLDPKTGHVHLRINGRLLFFNTNKKFVIDIEAKDCPYRETHDGANIRITFLNEPYLEANNKRIGDKLKFFRNEFVKDKWVATESTENGMKKQPKNTMIYDPDTRRYQMVGGKLKIEQSPDRILSMRFNAVKVIHHGNEIDPSHFTLDDFNTYIRGKPAHRKGFLA